MSDKYAQKLEEAEAFYNYDKLLNLIKDDSEFTDEEFSKKVLDASIEKLRTNDQKKTIRALAKAVVTDKVYFKEFREKVKNA